MTSTGADVVSTFEGRVVRDHVAVHRRLARSDFATEVLADLVARTIERQTVDVHSVAATAGAVGEVDLDAVAFVGTDHQRLDRVVAQTERDLTTGLLGTDRRNLAGECVHLAGRVVVTPAVQRDVDIDHRHVVGPGRSRRRADAGRCDRAGLRRRDRDDPDSERQRPSTTRRAGVPKARDAPARQSTEAEHRGADQQRHGEINEELGQHR